MQESIPTIAIPYILGVIGALLGIIWQNLNEKIKKLEKNICDVPTNSIQVDIADIKNDLKWIKQILNAPRL